MAKSISFVSFEEDEKQSLEVMKARSYTERLEFLRFLQKQFYAMPRFKDYDMYPEDKNRKMIELKRKKN